MILRNIIFSHHTVHRYTPLYPKLVTDEETHYSIGSDHNVVIVNIDIPMSKATKQDPPETIKVEKWNISEKTNWAIFNASSKNTFMNWDANEF